MALCPACLPVDVTVASSSMTETLPSLTDVKGGFADAIDEAKHLFKQARTWVKNDLKRYTVFKNWNIAFDKTGSIALAKDTVLAVLPIIIIGFISAKILLGSIPISGSLPTGEITKAAAFWMLNFALGIGITLSGSASASFLSGSAGGTARLIASGLTVLLTYLLIRKSRARAAQGGFTLNPQTEVAGTAAILSILSYLLTSLTANAFSASSEVEGASVSGSISVSVDFYSLFIGPLIISAITVLLGSHAVKNQKKISDALNQAVAFLLGATAVVSVVVILAALKERQIAIIPMYLAVAPTIVLAVLVAASGVPLVNTFSEKPISLMSADTGNPIDITHPTFSLVLYFGLLLIALLLIGTVMGFRIDPRTFTARSSTRIILTITSIVLFLNFFLMFYAFGSASAAFGLASTSGSIALFANPLYLIPASMMWGAVYVFGARYLTPMAAEMVPSLVSKVIPKLRISISDYYLLSPAKVEDLTPLQKQTKTMQAAKAKSIAKKGALVLLAFFIITGPANHAIANKISSPTSAVSGFFNALTTNDAGAALSHVILADDEISKDFLTDQVLKNYIHKPKVTSIEILQSDAEYATAHVEYTINGETYGSDISLEKDLQQKLYKIFPVWKISQGVMRQLETNGYDGKSVTLADTAVPAKAATIYLFPGTIRYSIDNPIFFNKFDYILPVDPKENESMGPADYGFKADANVYIEKRVRSIIAECNINSEKLPAGCPSFIDGAFQVIYQKVLKTVENLKVTNIQHTFDGYSFNVYFDGVLNYKDPSTGVNKTTNYNYEVTAELKMEDGLQAIIWNR